MTRAALSLRFPPRRCICRSRGRFLCQPVWFSHPPDYDSEPRQPLLTRMGYDITNELYHICQISSDFYTKSQYFVYYLLTNTQHLSILIIKVHIARDFYVPPIMAKQPKGCDAKLKGLTHLPKAASYRSRGFLLPLIDN